MATLTSADIERIALESGIKLGGFGSENSVCTDTVPVFSRPSFSDVRYLGRAGLLDLIVAVLKESSQPLTRRGVAKAIGRSKSPSLIGMLNELTTSKRISQISQINQRGNLEFSYTVKSEGGLR